MRVQEVSDTMRQYSGPIWAVIGALAVAWCLWMTVTVHKMAVGQATAAVSLKALVNQNEEFRKRIDDKLSNHEDRIRTVEIYSGNQRFPSRPSMN